MVTTMKKLVGAFMAAALALACASIVGVQTAQAEDAISKVNLICNISHIGLLPKNTEGDVQENLRASSKVATASVRMDYANTFLLWYDEQSDKLIGVGDGSKSVNADLSYYVSYSLKVTGDADWPSSVKKLGPSDERIIRAVPGISVWFNGFERSDCYLAYNSYYNMLIVMLPIWNNINATFSGTQFIYDGKRHKPAVTSVFLEDGSVVPSAYYKVLCVDSSRNEVEPINAGKYFMIVQGKGIYDSTAEQAFTIKKATNKLKVVGKTAKVAYADLKNGSRKLAVSKVLKIKTASKVKRAYKKLSGNKKISINAKTGKVTISKGIARGVYKVKVKVMAKSSNNYKKTAWKKATFTIKVK